MESDNGVEVTKIEMTLLFFIFSTSLLFFTYNLLEHSTIRIETKDKKIIYIDPYLIDTETKDADIILITHEHFDHCSPEDVKKIMKEDTIIFTEKYCAKILSVINSSDIKIVKPGDYLNIANIVIRVVPAYTSKLHHIKEKGYLGFVLEIEDARLYYMGDSQVASSYGYGADILFLPVDGIWTMSVSDAVLLAKSIEAKNIIPIHLKFSETGRELSKNLLKQLKDLKQ